MNVYLQHINIFFYYLRKMMNHGNVQKSLTTTDDLFDQTLYALLLAYDDPKVKDKKSLFTNYSIVSEYISGNMLQAGKPWSSINEVLIPVNTTEHWIMVRLDIKQRVLVVYDSIRNEGHDAHVRKILRRYSVLLPFYMSSLGIWSGRKYKGAKAKNSKPDPIQIVWQDGLPLQSLPDCGAYTMAFAEYYAVDKMGLLTSEFNIAQFRKRTACLLFHYGRMKIEDDFISDDELSKT